MCLAVSVLVCLVCAILLSVSAVHKIHSFVVLVQHSATHTTPAHSSEQQTTNLCPCLPRITHTRTHTHQHHPPRRIDYSRTPRLISPVGGLELRERKGGGEGGWLVGWRWRREEEERRRAVERRCFAASAIVGGGGYCVILFSLASPGCNRKHGGC